MTQHFPYVSHPHMQQAKQVHKRPLFLLQHSYNVIVVDILRLLSQSISLWMLEKLLLAENLAQGNLCQVP